MTKVYSVVGPLFSSSKLNAETIIFAFNRVSYGYKERAIIVDHRWISVGCTLHEGHFGLTNRMTSSIFSWVLVNITEADRTLA